MEVIMMSNVYEVLSWVATLMIIISFLIENMLWLRVVSLVGSILWVTYAIATDQLSLVVLNGTLIIIQIWKIFKLIKINKNSKL
jgi:hypothetical protein|tara:strand:+ start:54 stop:305 length:252 start_codon:yes stop_codon:yes gene_type:complete